ncbi:MAG: hypothetical protein IT208_10725 [Chthonomonadales bacterium]|nr:hypothetical protein [Chthonomonadales bacterium]
MTRRLSRLYVLVNVMLIGCCALQVALAGPGCDPDGHGNPCPPAPPGCDVDRIQDQPGSCCYMNGVSLCCSYYRQKVIYHDCPGLPDHCSECIAAPNPEPGATCNTSNGFCEY